ncbi:MAG: FecR family protein [Chitinophagaceae bacterium]|nr:FecR family protein [Chitinophagaceae bacterium]
MNHIPDHIKALIQKYLDGTASQQEKDTLNEWYRSYPADEIIVFTESTEHRTSLHIKQRLDKLIKKETSVSVNNSKKYIGWAAAFVGVSLILSIYYLFPFNAQNSKQQPASLVKNAEEIIPGSNKATLTLSDGTIITLDSANIGLLGEQGNTKIVKLAGGKLLYQAGEGTAELAQLFNTISTPRGGQYMIDLPDGTKVWLNASSSIRFPAVFKDSAREVSITGEAYFEVVHKSDQPFIVSVNHNKIVVLGTQFNVMAYANEASVNTTLLEGALLVQGSRSSQRLRPGNQVKLNAAGDMLLIEHANTEEAIAWKNGRFLFTGADMQSIMRQVERWYDVDVKFEGEVQLHFSGQLTRYASVWELLRKLELTNEVHFRIENRLITVIPGMKPQS